MPGKQRIEDLGRITEKLNELLKHELFITFEDKRCKDYDNEKMSEICYMVQYINEVLCDIYAIARWGDEEEK